MLCLQAPAVFLQLHSHLYDKNAEVSGVWFENKYPGCACDIPAHNYTYSFAPKHDWSTVYASSSEINRYFNDFATEHNLHRYIKLLHQVIDARWVEEEGKWYIKIKDLSSDTAIEDSCDTLINACGYLNEWKWPELPGLETFKGKLLHSASWDQNVNLEKKRVGLIGNGPSGVQILPEIQPIVEHLTAFFRTPTWVSGTVGGGPRAYKQEEIDEFRGNTDTLMVLRKRNEAILNSLFSAYLKDSPLQIEAKTRITSEMKAVLQDDLLEKQLIPTWGVGCRRLTPGPGFLESLRKENVEIVHANVLNVTAEGCKCDDGKEYSLDILICATGFDGSFIPRFPIRGPGNINLQDIWAIEPKSYLGIGAAAFPNLLMFLGPHSPFTNGPLLSAIEAQADHILMLIDPWQTENIHSFFPKEAAVTDFLAHIDNFMKKTVWSQDCPSWYKNYNANKRVSLWPGSTLHHIESLKDLRADDWDIRYKGNRFAWLGNGFSQTELDPVSDLAYYIRDSDDSPYASRSKRRKALTKSGSRPVRALHTIQYMY